MSHDAAIEHVLGSVAHVPDAELAPDQEAVVNAATAWANDFLAPRAETWERERRFASEAFQSAAAHGFTGLLAPTADGGAGLNTLGLARVLEPIAAVDWAVAFILVCHNNLAGATSRLAPPTLRAERLPQLISGAKVGAFLFTEPNAGSDPATMTTTAKPDGDGWTLDGTKAWVTNGTHAGLLSIYAQTDLAAGHRGIATFLVDATKSGVTRGEAYEMFGGHAAGINDVRLNGCEVSSGELFIPVGEGFRAAMAGIDIARVLVGAMCCGMLARALSVAVDYVKNRIAFGGRVADLGGIRFMLADVATDLVAARLLAYRAARLLADGEPATQTAAHAKKFATRVTEAGIATCMQVMGANGAKRDYGLARQLAAARLTHYIDGTTEIQNVVISRALLD